MQGLEKITWENFLFYRWLLCIIEGFPALFRSVLPLPLELKDTLHNAFSCLDLFRFLGLFPKRLQDQTEIHLDHRSRYLNRWDGFPFLQQLQGDTRILPFLLLCPGQYFRYKGLGQRAEGGQKQPLLREHRHMGFYDCNGVH